MRSRWPPRPSAVVLSAAMRPPPAQRLPWDRKRNRQSTKTFSIAWACLAGAVHGCPCFENLRQVLRIRKLSDHGTEHCPRLLARSAREIQSGERERSPQLERGGLLPARGLEGLREGGFGRDDITGVLAQQQLATPPVDFRREPLLSGSLHLDELLVEDRERLVELPLA